MQLTLKILGGDGTVRAVETGENRVQLHYAAAYEQGDVLCVECSGDVFLHLRLEDSIAPAVVYLKGTSYGLAVPFGEKRVSYSPKSFMGESHLLEARIATGAEIDQYRNLALNPLDCHENTTLFPHAKANVETRGEAVFAARNAIDGNTANHGHGPWPYQSWGINQQADAELLLDFGRPVTIDSAVLTLRADFPHDNWWEQAQLKFSDGSTETIRLIKSDAPQSCPIAPRTVTSVTLCCLKKCETDPSPFPALTQIEFWGWESK